MAPGVRGDSGDAPQTQLPSVEGDAIQVFVRIRPPAEGTLLPAEGDPGMCLSVLASNTIRLHSKPEPKMFTFDHVATMDATQGCSLIDYSKLTHWMDLNARNLRTSYCSCKAHLHPVSDTDYCTFDHFLNTRIIPAHLNKRPLARLSLQTHFCVRSPMPPPPPWCAGAHTPSPAGPHHLRGIHMSTAPTHILRLMHIYTQAHARPPILNCSHTHTDTPAPSHAYTQAHAHTHT